MKVEIEESAVVMESVGSLDSGSFFESAGYAWQATNRNGEISKERLCVRTEDGSVCYFDPFSEVVLLECVDGIKFKKVPA